MKNKRLLIIFLLSIIFATAFSLLRPDVEIALWVISHASDLPEGDARVNIASQYLIWTKHPRIYEALPIFLLACDGTVDCYDARAEQASHILGSLHTEESIEALLQLITKPNYGDGFPYCLKYIWNAFRIQGQHGTEELLKIARGETTILLYFRRGAVRLLGEFGNPNFVEPFSRILLTDDNDGLAYAVITALADIGTEEARAVVRKTSEMSPDSELRDFSSKVMDGWGDQVPKFEPACPFIIS